ncbi:hypothetical protein OF829_06775 [Sphingomonas sp. LB-2]|uniref:hypothetical protein n=1 Tax=Sphingomonas caeni TaxID=2984949 RepID=UPI002232916E|nr:hypothetical protein [Sphingomonas caeni]MCW3846938.1 hypothetical protein [Sphingomonas caeni]
MAARLGRAPIPWREVGAVLGVAFVLGVVALLAWAGLPAAGAQTQIAARIVRMMGVRESKYDPPLTLIEVELPNGRRSSVTMPYATIGRCKVGDTIDMTFVPTNVGAMAPTADPGSCR